uniref:Uncharacterized protein n=1 Tax=Anguilla anguilla TaxID=7936 RepID=A0A0E9QNR3_ANGAN
MNCLKRKQWQVVMW